MALTKYFLSICFLVHPSPRSTVMYGRVTDLHRLWPESYTRCFIRRPVLAYHVTYPRPCDESETKSMPPVSQFLSLTFLVHTLEWRNSLALGLVKRVADDLAVGQVDLAVGLLLERQGVLHPVDVVTVGEVFTGVGTTGFLSVGGRGSGLSTVCSSSVHIITKKYHSIVTHAQVRRFLSSIVSTRSEFQIMLRSLMPTSLNMPSTSVIFSTP